MDPSFRGRTPRVPYSNGQPGRRPRLTPRTLLMIAVGVVVVIIGIVLLASSGDKTGPLQQRLDARLETLLKMTAEGDKYIKDSELREFNGRLRIQITSDQQSLSTVFKASKPDPLIIAKEADTASFDSLKDAQLNSRFDEAYRKLIAQKLDSTKALIKEIYGKTLSKSLKTELNLTYTNLERLETQITAATAQ